jgi:hypothetical protein
LTNDHLLAEDRACPLSWGEKMFALDSAGDAYDLEELVPAWELRGWRDPAGNDVGERLKPVRLTWTITWGDRPEIDGEVCCPRSHRALHWKTGPLEIAMTACQAIHRKIRDEVGHDGLRHPRHGGRPHEPMTIYLTAEYHYLPDKNRQREGKTYPVEEKCQRRRWTFDTGDPRTPPAFQDGFRKLYQTIRQQGLATDARAGNTARPAASTGARGDSASIWYNFHHVSHLAPTI